MLSDDSKQDRRSFLKLAGTAGIAGLAGCSGGGGDKTTTSTDSGGEKTTTKSGGGGENATLRVGYLSWLSGPLASAGTQHKQGADIALEAIGSASGGIDIEWIAKDSKGSPEIAVKRARELVQQEDVDMLTGCTTSASGKAVQQFAASQGIPFVHGATQTPDVTKKECKKQTFRFCTNIIHQQVTLAEGLARLTPDDATRVAGVNPDYVYGKQSWKIFKEQFKKRRPDVEFVSAQFPAFMKGEYKKEIQATLDANPDIVHSVLYSGDMISFIKQAQQFDFFEEVNHFGSGGLDLVAQALGDQMVEAVGYNPTNWAWDQSRMQEFTKKFTEKHNAVPDGFFAGYGHANVDCIAAAVKEAGSTEKSALIDAFEGLSFDSVIPTTTIRPGDHQGFHDSYLVGKYGPVENDPLPDQTVYGMQTVEEVPSKIVREVDTDKCEAF